MDELLAITRNEKKKLFRTLPFLEVINMAIEGFLITYFSITSLIPFIHFCMCLMVYTKQFGVILDHIYHRTTGAFCPRPLPHLP